MSTRRPLFSTKIITARILARYSKSKISEALSSLVVSSEFEKTQSLREVHPEALAGTTPVTLEVEVTHVRSGSVEFDLELWTGPQDDKTHLQVVVLEQAQGDDTQAGNAACRFLRHLEVELAQGHSTRQLPPLKVGNS